MKAHRITVVVLDHEGMGGAAVAEVLETTRYPNWCISPSVVKVESVDIGEWDDDHPLNQRGSDMNAPFDQGQANPLPARDHD